MTVRQINQGFLKQFGSDDAPQQDAWIERVSVNGLAPQVREYLEGLGAATVEGLGYTYATAVERLSSATGCASAAVNARMAKTVVTDGERRFAEGDLDTAEQLFHAALDLDASDTDALNNLGVAHWQRGDTATALEYLARGLSVAPGDRILITNTATVLHALGNTEDAVRYAAATWRNTPTTWIYERCSIRSKRTCTPRTVSGRRTDRFTA